MTRHSKKQDPSRSALMVAGYATAFAILGASILGNSQPEESEQAIQTMAEDTVQTDAAETTTVSTTPTIEPAYAKCPPTTRACVDLTAKKSWLQKDGKIEYGPVSINSGQPGWETPPGNYHIMRHVKDEVSHEFNLQKMPWSTYFSPLGMAFHEDDITTMSHGCVHMTAKDAEHYFHTLKVGDSVVIF